MCQPLRGRAMAVAREAAPIALSHSRARRHIEDMMIVRAPILVLSAAVLLLPGCGEEPAAAPRENKTDTTIAQAAGATARPLAARLLELAPAREEDSAPAAGHVQALLPECLFADAGLGPEARGSCDLTVGGERATIEARLHVAGEQATALRLAAPHGAVLSPPGGQSTLRSELLCRDLTLVASASTQVHRISAPGKRDLVYVESRDPAGGEASLILLLSPVAPGAECAAIAAESDFFEGRSGPLELAKPDAMASPFTSEAGIAQEQSEQE